MNRESSDESERYACRECGEVLMKERETCPVCGSDEIGPGRGWPTIVVIVLFFACLALFLYIFMTTSVENMGGLPFY